MDGQVIRILQQYSSNLQNFNPKVHFGFGRTTVPRNSHFTMNLFILLLAFRGTTKFLLCFPFFEFSIVVNWKFVKQNNQGFSRVIWLTRWLAGNHKSSSQTRWLDSSNLPRVRRLGSYRSVHVLRISNWKLSSIYLYILLLIGHYPEFEKPMNLKRYYSIDLMTRESPRVIESDSVTRVIEFVTSQVTWWLELQRSWFIISNNLL